MDTSGTPQSAERDKFAMIPKMANDDLDIFEYRLFGHYSQVCGQKGGRCFQSAETIRQKTGMSYGVIKKARNGLQSKGFITVEIPDGKSRNQGMNISVSLVDRWAENTARYQEVITNMESRYSTKANHLITNMELADYAAVPEQEELYKQESLKEEKTTAFAQPANQESVAGASEDVVVSDGEKLHIRIFSPVNMPLLPARVPESAAQFSSTTENPASTMLQESAAQSLPVEGAVSSTPHPVPVNPPPEPDNKPLQEHDNPLGRVLSLLENGVEGWGKLLGKTDTDNAQLALDEHPEDWVTDAIKEAKFKNKKFWGFVTGCLNNWKSDGFKSPTYNRQEPTPSSTGYVEPEREFMKFTGFQKFDTAQEGTPC